MSEPFTPRAAWRREVLGTPRDLLRLRHAIYVAATLTIFLIACEFDSVGWRHWHTGKGVETEDWYRLLRLFGWLPTWAWVAAVLFSVDFHRAGGAMGASVPVAIRIHAALSRSLLVLLSTLLAGGLAEALKPALRRLRPDATDGEYVFRSLFDWPGGVLDGTGLGLPSGHTAVAFAGVFVLMRLLPGAWPVLLLAAIGCAASRVIVGAHFVSDTALSACLAWAIVAWVWNAHRATEKLKSRLD